MAGVSAFGFPDAQRSVFEDLHVRVADDHLEVASGLRTCVREKTNSRVIVMSLSTFSCRILPMPASWDKVLQFGFALVSTRQQQQNTIAKGKMFAFLILKFTVKHPTL